MVHAQVGRGSRASRGVGCAWAMALVAFFFFGGPAKYVHTNRWWNLFVIFGREMGGG